jgi:hypothetical protein
LFGLAAFAVLDVALVQASYKVGEDGHVEKEDTEFEEGEAVEDFVDFDGNEAGGGDDGEPLGPEGVEEEADAFAEVEAAVDEGADGKEAELGGGDAGDFFDEGVDVVVFGIEAKFADPGVEDFEGVGAKEAEEVEAEDEQEGALEEFGEGNELEQEGAAGVGKVGHGGSIAGIGNWELGIRWRVVARAVRV